jgi:long-chain fatty acid transport protein
MGGVATAAPLDCAGALYWNPATIAALPASDCSVSCEMILPRSEVRSRIEAGALGPGVPAIAMEGTSESDSGVAPVPAIAFVHKPQGQSWAFGLGLFGIGGFNGNYAASQTNPIFTAPPPNGLGVGRIAAQLDILQLAPTAAWILSDHVSIGLAPTITLARLTASPAFFGPADDANGDGSLSYPDATGTPYHWGAGFQTGIYYTGDGGWHFGASVKSPQWFETFEFSSVDELGRPRTFSSDFDYPLIASVGTAYSGIAETVLACDVRYFDYAGASGFGDAGFDANGAAAGLGWRSVVAVSTGVERRLNDRLSLRAGYAFNENPVPDFQASANLASSLIIKHWLSTGLSYQAGHHWIVSLAYVHGFENEISGPIVTPLGPIPGTRVTERAWLDSIIAGASVRF